jgi:multicomponent Na+:H+ antiporter subunit B
MYSLILRSVTVIMLPVLLLFSIFLLLRGHDWPGGGFIGGLVAASAILLNMVALGPRTARESFPINYSRVLVLGGLLAAASGLPGLITGGSFLQGIWYEFHLFGDEPLKIGTPLFFDIGVYLVVFAVSVEVIMSVAEEDEWKALLPWSWE